MYVVTIRNDCKYDGFNDGLWCQSSAMNVSGNGSWQLPNGSGVTDDLNGRPVHMANRPGQVGLLRNGGIGISPYQGMYTCTIHDENGVIQTLVAWAAGNSAYDGSASNCEFITIWYTYMAQDDTCSKYSAKEGISE